jgi:hypothetical protein
MAQASEKDRATGSQSRGALNRGAGAAAPSDSSPAQTKPTPNSAKQLAKIAAEFVKKADANKKKDLGERPGLLERAAVESQWRSIDAASGIVFLLAGKDYDMSKKMMHHYLIADGAPLVYQPPEPVSDAIKKRFPLSGHYRDVSGYDKWGTPDIRNGLGHFNLDVVKDETGAGLVYVITDRYEFPEKSKGNEIYHGFQVGKLSKPTADSLNARLADLGQYQRETGAKEKFELKKDPSTGEYTFIIPQKLLVDHGADFDSMGIFASP